jgi:3-hydroxyisobutyrate dehydrogenase-like beta-hydroxyacid dehydrogenase
MRVGFIGLGTMGASMALNLQAAEHEVAVNDLRRDAAAPHLKAGATWADGPRQIAAHSEVIFTSLPGPREVEAVADILIEHMKPGTAWFDLSTNSPTVIRKLHARFAAKNIALLDAPVSGGPVGAKTRKLALLVGGDKTVFDKYKPALDAIGDQVIYIGPIGAGSVAKLVHNMAGYAMQTALAEVFTMGVKAGVEPLALWSAVRQCSLGRQRTFDRLGKQFLRGEFDPPDFALKLAHKDVMLATELARDVGVPMRIAELTRAEMGEALNRGWGARDSRVPMLLQEERAGVSIKVPAADIEAVMKRDG